MAVLIPLMFKVDEGRPCLVVGGGEVAWRKVLWLLECGACVEALSPRFEPDLEDLARARHGALTLRREAYGERDLGGYAVVIAATDRPEVNGAVARDARRVGVPVNVVDDPDPCSFFVPATVRRGDLTIAIGTGGSCPSLAARLRRELEAKYPAPMGIFVAALGRVRRDFAGAGRSMPERRDLMDYLAGSEVAERVMHLNEEAMVVELRRLGEDFWRGRTTDPGPKGESGAKE